MHGRSVNGVFVDLAYPRLVSELLFSVKKTTETVLITKQNLRWILRHDSRLSVTLAFTGCCTTAAAVYSPSGQVALANSAAATLASARWRLQP
jgi:hypothetical protein